MVKEILDTIIEKRSTWSSIVYLISGWFFFIQSEFMFSLTGIVMMGLGVCSAGYHWTKTPKWQTADVIAIYAVLWMLIYTIFHFLIPETPYWIILGFPILKSLIMGTGKRDFNSMRMVPIMYLLLFVLLYVHYPGGRAWSVTLFMLLGVFCQFLGERWWPEHRDNFHTAWHIFTNIGFFLTLYQIDL